MISVEQRAIDQTKLDEQFLLALNDYLDRFKAKIYKDLIRRDTSQNPARTLTALLRCLWQISFEQAKDIARAVLYTMTAIDYILHRHFPPSNDRRLSSDKGLLFNYILIELIDMWIHENLRGIQEDFPLLAHQNRIEVFEPLCQKFISICTINWERLQMLQNYRLAHFDQLMTSTLETKKDFLRLFGQSISDSFAATVLYSYRTEKELTQIALIEQRFRTAMESSLPREDLPFPPAAGDHIERERVSIEVTHDPSRCNPYPDHPSNNACLISTDSFLTFSITVEDNEHIVEG